MVTTTRSSLIPALVITMLVIGVKAKQQPLATSTAGPEPKKLTLEGLIGDMRAIVKLGLTKGDEVGQVCDDACGLLDSDRILHGTFMRDYMRFCEKHCPAALSSSASTEILESDEALKTFILKNFRHEEL